MKELKAAVMTIILALSLTACSQGSNSAGTSTNQPASSGLQSGAITSQTASSSETPLNSSGGEKRILVAYFSWSGNTQEMASYIAQQTGGDLLELQPEIPYPTDYNQCGEVALNERDTNARPAISNLPSSISEYDAVLLGYPIWLAYHKLIQCTQIA